MEEDSTSDRPINITTTSFQLGMCMLLNLPSDHLECISTTSHSNQAQSNTHHCISCSDSGLVFSTGEGLDDYYSRGHLTLLALHGITGVIGVWGAFASCLIIAVLRRRASGSSFDLLLTALAWIDMSCCIAYVVFAAAISSWYQNWNRNFLPLFAIYLGINFTFLAKSGSTLITIVITIERYVALAFPFRAKRVFSPFKTKVLVAFVLVFTCFNGAARLGSSYIGKNRVDPGIVTTSGMDYLIYPSTKLKCLTCFFDLLDQILSIPVLFVFNILIFYNIRKISARRKELSCSQTRELNAGKMILPIVAVLLLCSIIPIGSILFRLGKASTELLMLAFSFYAVNSAVNFPLYVWSSASFRSEAKVMLGNWTHWLAHRHGGGNNNEGENAKTPRTSSTDPDPK